ncbi:hypothetical protein DFA_07040 [Cavenderia fasciculata]|uniref:Cytokinin riboside 5'-monophosphate phosphoribohydrolase n=1 Tax=Cavenderia fasciculata TaxID=261658 RepID=F4PVB8_CACFS|nr:uncharacterized protein DFA_07040 [Cavenderia fasciculata]EGG19932.1 hypothetical protein DFA_07040 [Cavenderia fasciculata]|eukprot:XP_004366915.1 hypothetical protein DFA_07040 [Cavenderia fasciculata]
MISNQDIKNICIFCGSRTGTDPLFVTKTEQLGQEMAKRGYGLVYGGGNVGLMGAISHAVFNGGASVKGIIPHALSQREVSGVTVGEVEFVEDMHTRKNLMYKLSNAFIALPGGFGTFDELFECLTWIQLGIHAKPVEDASKKGFIDERFVTSIVFSDDPVDLLNRIETAAPVKSVLDWHDVVPKP